MARLIAIAILIGLATLYFKWPDLARMHATETAGDVALTVYTREVAPGGTIDAHVRLDGGTRAAIGTIEVTGAGRAQRFGGVGAGWGDRITDSLDEATAKTDFAIDVPPDVAPGSELELAITVHYVEAHAMIGTFTNDRASEKFTYRITVMTPFWATAFKIGRIALALGSWFLVVGLLAIGGRWYARRERSPSSALLILVLPYSYLGYVWFANQLSIATGANATPFVLLAMSTWLGALGIGSRVADSASRRHYRVTSAVPKPETVVEPDPYRVPGTVPVRTASVEEVTDAWLRTGLIVIEKRGHLTIKMMNGSERAIVTIPKSRVFGDEPFDIRARYSQIVRDMITALVPLLGPLRCRVDVEPVELSFDPAT